MLSRQNDDEHLIRKSKNGDAEAFGELYERYAEVIFRYVYSHIDSRLDAEDLTEDIFMRAWKALDKYDDRGLPFSAFFVPLCAQLINRLLPPAQTASID